MLLLKTDSLIFFFLAAVMLFVAFALIPVIVVIYMSQKRAAAKKPHAKKNPQEMDLVGQLAHEIKNPLSTIKVNLKLISEDLDDIKKLIAAQQNTAEITDHKLPSAARKISVTAREADRLEQILDAFLRYADKIELSLVLCDIDELLDNLIDFYSPQAQSNSVIIRCSLAKEKLTCKADADLIKQALLNIFINAQQAMDNGGELLIRTHKADSTAIIQISDTGKGIPPDKLESIFDVYFSTRPGGKGFGLPIAKKIIEAHKGKITVRSETGKGTEFTIQLPLFENDAERKHNPGS